MPLRVVLAILIPCFRFRRNSLGHRNGAYLRFDNGTPPRRRSRPEAFAWPLLERVHPRGSSGRARKEITSGSSCWSSGTTGRSVLICFMACPGAHFGRLKGSSFSRMRHLFQTFKNTTFNNISRMTPRIWNWSGYVAKTKSSNIVSAKPRRLSKVKKSLRDPADPAGVDQPAVPFSPDTFFSSSACTAGPITSLRSTS